MSANFRYPNITGKSEREQLTQITSFLRQLVDQLNYELSVIGTGDSSSQLPSTVRVQGGEEQSAYVTREELKAAMDSIIAQIADT